MSLRQRDQSEKNLSCEVQKMQQDIQASERENMSFINSLREYLYFNRERTKASAKGSAKPRKVSKLSAKYFCQLVLSSSPSILVR